VRFTSDGAGRRVNATSAESTLGTGQNTDLGTVPARRTSAYQAAFTLGTPYVRLPGPAASRSATSACTITSPCARSGNSANKCNTTGTATLYGKFATSEFGATGRSSALSVSA